jgi:PDZ domain-containing protein
VRRIVTPARLAVLGLALIVVAFLLYVLPSQEYVFLPDPAHPVAPLVSVQGGHDPTHGEVLFVDVVVRKATWLERLFHGIRKGASYYPASAIDPKGVSQAGLQAIDRQDMQRSQKIAAAVALKALGKKVTMRPTGALVEQIGLGAPAEGKLHPDDRIVAVGKKPIRALSSLYAAMRGYRPGDVVRFTVVRQGKQLVVPITTVASADKPPRAIVGIIPSPAVDIQLPLAVRIDAGNVGGPSAGLAFALEVMEELGRNVVDHHKVAATGELEPDGTVGQIGGIEQKTIGVREAGADVFLVPAGENAVEAEKEAHGLRIIPVKSFQQALHALATLPPKA